MHNRNVSALNLEHHNVADTYRVLLVVGEKQEIATVESWLHRTAEK